MISGKAPLTTAHSQSSSENTVPTKPLTRSHVHTLAVGGRLNFSRPGTYVPGQRLWKEKKTVKQSNKP